MALKKADGQVTPLERQVGPEWRRELSTVLGEGFGYSKQSLVIPSRRSSHFLLRLTTGIYPRPRDWPMRNSSFIGWSTCRPRDGRLPFFGAGEITTRSCFSSPLKAFLNQAAWLPLARGDDIIWAKPGDAWFAPKADPMPRFVRRIEQSVREVIETRPRRAESPRRGPRSQALE